MEYINKIAFLFSGAPHEYEALNIISSSPQKFLLTVITTVAELPMFRGRENLTMKVVSNVMEPFTSDEAEKEAYDLVVMGANR